MNHFTRLHRHRFSRDRLAGTGVLHADTSSRADVRARAASGPAVTTYATGLTNPRGLVFGL